jgi:hypothetical protein
MKLIFHRPRLLSLLGVAALLAGCATGNDPAGYEYAPYSPAPGYYAWCPPPCMYPESAWAYRDFSDPHFFYPAMPYFYDPFEFYGGTQWFFYTRPVPPKPPPAPRPPTRQPPPRDRDRH